MGKVLLLALGLSCAWLCPLGRLCAQPDTAVAGPASTNYDDAIRRAIEEFDAGHWEEARALFRSAHEIDPNARTWRGLGITAFELRRYVDAVNELQSALTDTLKPLTDRQRAELEELRGRARAFVSTYGIALAPANATLQVDGQPAELRGGELLLDPGTHLLLVRAEGYQDRHAELRADAGQYEQITIELQREPAQRVEPPAPSAPSAPAPREREPGMSARRVWVWTLGSAALATVATAGVVGGLALKKNRRYNAGCDENSEEGLSSDECGWLFDDGKRRQNAANALIGVASAFAISALVLYLTEDRARRRLHSTLWLERGGGGVASAFAF